MKLQFAVLKRLLSDSRKFASTATAKYSKNSKQQQTPPVGNKNNKSTGTDISKMPQPHPVLTPLARTASDQLSIDHLPAIESIASCDKFIHRIELGNELQKRLPKSLVEVAGQFGGNLFVLRRKLIEEAYESLKETEFLIIDGSNGSGKSVLLMKLYASIKNDPNKLILYAPNVHKWTTGYFAYYPVEQEGKVINYKQPELALEILRLLVVCNAEAAKLPAALEQQINEAKLDSYNRAIPLYEKTMKELAEKEIYMFFDGVNGLIDENSLTGYTDRNGNAVPLKHLPLCHEFFHKSNNKRRIVGALTHSNPALPHVNPIKFKTIRVPNYSQEELKQALQLYSQVNHCASNKSDQFIAFKAFVSGSNGRKLYKSCEYDSIYYKN